MKNQLFLAFLFFSTFFKVQSQIAGSFTVPGSFPTLAAAINTLNLTGVAGAVTINVTAGYTETVPLGGLKLINPPGSSTTTILFTKQGVGANPLLLAYAGGTATSNSGKRDGIWMMAGCRNITIDAIDLFDPNTSTPASMEFGYSFYRTTTSGCLNNTIRNCVITLASPTTGNARGIELSVTNYSANTTTVTPTSTLLTNSYNTFHNNRITKCDQGIWMTGYLQNNFRDFGNDVGGLSSATSNTIVNYGGGTSFPSAIFAENQFQFNASYNRVNNNDGGGSTAANGVRGIYNTGFDATIVSNTISLESTGMTNNNIIGISQSAYAANVGTVNINNNIFSGLSSGGLGVSSHSIIAAEGNRVTYLNNNTLGNFTASNGTVNLISASGGYTTFIGNNTISGATITTEAIITGIQCSTTYSQNISNNSIANLFGPPAASNATFTVINGIKCPAGATITIADNTVNDIYSYISNGISLTGTSTAAPASFSVVNNSIYNLGLVPTSTIGAVTTGIFADITPTTGVMTIKSNTISNLVGRKSGNLTSGGGVRGIQGSGGANAYASTNKIYDLYTNGTSGVRGLSMGSPLTYIFNNLIGGLNSASTGYVFGMEFDQAGTSRVHFNTIYMNTSVSTNTAGTTLISSIGSSILELRNNVLVNASTGPGFPAVVSANNILSTSNNNAFYFGTNLNGRVHRNVATSTVLAGYQAAFNSDAQSFVENVNFVSITGSNPNFLNINTTIPTQIESGAVAIPSITADYIGTTRSAVPDVGAWEGNYTQADATKPVVVSSGFTGPPCNGSTRTFTANITDVSGVASGSLSPRVYHRVNFNLYTSTQGTLTSGTATNGVWSFALNYSAVTNDVIWHFLVVQDVSYLNNLLIVPATNATVTDVNNVSVPPNPANNYTIQTNPTISLVTTNTTICTGQSFMIQASGASSYIYLPGNSAVVNPVANTVYTVTGASSLGCPSTNTLTLSITVAPLPTVTVNSGSICAGQSFTMVPGGAVSYTYQGGSAIVSPPATGSYTVAGTAANGCSAFATANIMVVAPVLTVTAVQNTVCVGEPISVTAAGATNYTWQPGTQAGATYTAILNANTTLTVTGVDANGCQSTANINMVADACTGINELMNDFFSVWPNPTSGSLYIKQQGQPNDLLISIKDLSGRIIMQKQTNSLLSLIDLTGYANGVYVVEIFAGDNIISRSKLILAQQ